MYWSSLLVTAGRSVLSCELFILANWPDWGAKLGGVIGFQMLISTTKNLQPEDVWWVHFTLFCKAQICLATDKIWLTPKIVEEVIMQLLTLGSHWFSDAIYIWLTVSKSSVRGNFLSALLASTFCHGINFLSERNSYLMLKHTSRRVNSRKLTNTSCWNVTWYDPLLCQHLL